MKKFLIGFLGLVVLGNTAMAKSMDEKIACSLNKYKHATDAFRLKEHQLLESTAVPSDTGWLIDKESRIQIAINSLCKKYEGDPYNINVINATRLDKNGKAVSITAAKIPCGTEMSLYLPTLDLGHDSFYELECKKSE